MHPRRLRSIAQVREADRFGILGEGLAMLAENVHNLTEDIEDRGKNRRFQAAAVLSCFAEEEAAKILILLDIARAGWSDRDAVGRAMDAFYAHLARGLYVRAYDGSPADLGEVRRYVDSWRQEFYLDGPMDVDWIFNNEVLASREERLYVDYVEFEDGDRRWIGPKQRTALFDEPFMYPPSPAVVVRLVRAMHRIGLLTATGLTHTREVFDGVVMDDATHWSELRPLTIEIVRKLLTDSNLENESILEAAKYVVDRWIFPLTSLDLTLTKVDVDALKNERAHRLAEEAGWI